LEPPSGIIENPDTKSSEVIMSEESVPERQEKVATWQFWAVIVLIVVATAGILGWGAGGLFGAPEPQAPSLAVYDQEVLIARIMEIEGDDVSFQAQMKAMDKAQEIAQGFSERTGMIVVVSGAVFAYPPELDVTESLVSAAVEDLYGEE
jgi:hypothetical protein